MAKRPAESDDDSGSESSASASREEEEVATLSDEQLYKLQKQVRFGISFLELAPAVQRATCAPRPSPRLLPGDALPRSLTHAAQAEDFPTSYEAHMQYISALRSMVRIRCVAPAGVRS